VKADLLGHIEDEITKDTGMTTATPLHLRT
jgi:hypothetical protein